MLDRTQAPISKPLSIPKLPLPNQKTLPNGVDFVWFEDSAQSLACLELLFPGSNLETSHKQSTAYAFRMLLEGTKHKSAKQLADAISYLGASLDLGHHPDFDSIQITCLSRYLPDVLKLLSEMWQEPAFPDKEWNTMVETTNQQFTINLQKTNFLAGRLLRKQLFGTRNDYGYSHDPELIKTFSPELFRSNFNFISGTGPALALFSGGATAAILGVVEDWLHTFSRVGKLPVEGEILLETQKPGVYWHHKDGSQQASVKIGQFGINARHPDSPLFNLTLEIFGGYFGSRLMSNIREDKGWTYGIYAQRVSYSARPYWVVGSDVKGDAVHQVLNEIRNESQILQSELVSEDELEKVKNYMLGQFLGSITNCFGLADRYKSVWLNQVDFATVENNLSKIQHATASQVLESAQLYLGTNDGIIAIAGEKQ